MATTPSTFNPQTDSCCGRIVAAIDMVNDPTSKTQAQGYAKHYYQPKRCRDRDYDPPTTNGYKATSFREIITKAIKAELYYR